MARQMREEGESSSSSDRLPGKQDPTGSRARISLPRFFLWSLTPLSLSDELFLALALVWCGVDGKQQARGSQGGETRERERESARAPASSLSRPPPVLYPALLGTYST
jgi:hypothetical protein